MTSAERIGTRIGAFLDHFGIRPVANWEFAFMRVAFAALVIFSFPDEEQLFTTQQHPNGIANLFDLTFLAVAEIYRPLEIVAYVALAIYAIGILPVVPLAYLTWFSIVTKTLANSQGGIGHSFQMVSLVLLAQFIVSVFALVLPLIKNRKFRLFQDRGWNSTALYYTQLGIAGTYVTAAVTKLNNTGISWLWKSPYLATDLVKTDRQSYYAGLDAERFGAFAAPVDYVNFITENPMLSRILFAPGVLFELGAFLALLGRRWSLAVGLALVALHLGIKEVMHLNFLKNELCVTIFYVNIPFWLYYITQRVRRQHVRL